MRKLTILIDFDDVLNNLCEVWVNMLNERHGLHVALDDVKDWDISLAFPTLDKNDIYKPLFTDGLWWRVRPLPLASETVKRLIEDGHKVVIVTATHPDTIHAKFQCVLFKYFPYITMNDVIITSQKQLIRGDILIDDAPHNLIGGEYIKLLFDAPHNRNYPAEENNMTRVHDWNDIYAYINAIANSEGR